MSVHRFGVIEQFAFEIDIEPDEDNPSARLTALDETGDQLASVMVAPSFKLTRASAVAWVEKDFKAPR